MATFTEVIGRVTVIVEIPDRTPEEKAIRDKEIKEDLLRIYRQMEANGRAHILLGNKTG